MQKNKDFPVKILETEEKNDNLTDRDRSSTPFKKTKNNNEENYLYERFMRNKKSDKGKDKSKSFKQNRKKNHKNNDSIKTTIDCRPKSKNNRKLKEIKSKSKSNLIYNTFQNEDDQKPFLTIQDSNREKFGNTLHKNKSEYNNFTEANTGNKNSLKKQHSELGDPNKDIDLEDSDIEFNLKKNKKKYHSKGKYIKKKQKINLYYDPLNPYLTNWANSFLKIGYNVGLHSNQNQDGVPILRIQKLKPKVVLPPIYKVKYNQFSETKNNVNTKNEQEMNLDYNKVAQKLFSPSSTNYNNFPRNKSKNSFLTQLNMIENENNENNGNKNEEREKGQMNEGLKIETEDNNKEDNQMKMKEKDNKEKLDNKNNNVNIAKES